jgi:hypothetical protein
MWLVQSEPLERVVASAQYFTGVSHGGYSSQAQNIRSRPRSDRRCSTCMLGESQGQESRPHREPPKTQAVRPCPHQNGPKSTLGKVAEGKEVRVSRPTQADCLEIGPCK